MSSPSHLSAPPSPTAITATVRLHLRPPPLYISTESPPSSPHHPTFGSPPNRHHLSRQPPPLPTTGLLHLLRPVPTPTPPCMTRHISRGCVHSAHAECFGVRRAVGPDGVPLDAASNFRNHHSDLRTPYNTYPSLESHLR
ncbi:hypothetical protein RHMOL_Rhmol03G0121400 [Rhododendron molle]|uniref:Uncharacterized protein n=1 Tax=Rhododendron molle TaxID=49168 RepID=A0ACC0PEI8_RHOML|nr:hypothetical protein RHMOL_Rhmol03G0121400 [Rhododendron molle]